jgi:hypothetical protein
MTEFESPRIEEDYAQAIDRMLEKGEHELQKFISDFKSEERIDYANARSEKEVQNVIPKPFSNVALAVEVTMFTAKELRWTHSKYVSEKMQEQEHKETGIKL